MKRIAIFSLFAATGVLTSCDPNETSSTASPEPGSPSPLVEAPSAAIPVDPVPAEDPSAAPEEPLDPIDEDPVVLEEPATTAGQKLDHAIERTEEGLRRALEATGRGLQHAGEKIEEKASGQ